ncbi:MAG: hypothetical protein ACXW4Q_07910 [Anaerolineales bacterium]
MRKSTVFISAVLTTFALVMLYSLVSAYRGNKNVVEAAALPTATRTPEATDTPVPTEMIITPEEAAQLAAQVVGHDNLLSAESSNINGLDAYKITFTNNDVVYISPDGQILSVQVAPVVVNIAAPVKQKKNNNNNNGNSGGDGPSVSSEGDHEEHEDD